MVALVACPDYLTPEEVADTLYHEHPSELEATEILIVRPRVDRPLSDGDNDTASLLPFIERAPRATLHRLYTHNYSIKLSANFNTKVEDKLSGPDVQALCINWLRKTELYSFVARSNALFKARENFLYRSPSQKYFSTFLRVGNIQMNREVLDAVFFWMLPNLSDRDAILTETWSISSIALNAARLLDLYRFSLNRDHDNPCRVNFLSSYHDGSLDVVPDTLDALRRVSDGGLRPVLVLISAISTGNALRNLRDTIAISGFDPTSFSYLALFKLSQGTDVEALCDLATFDGQRFQQTERPDDKTIIEIDRHTYFPLSMRETTVVINKAAAHPAKQFFTDYQGSGTLSLHRDSKDLNGLTRRHHGIYIDVVAMLDTTQFQSKFDSKVSEVDRRPALIVVPPHTAGQKMGKYVSQWLRSRFGNSNEVIVHQSLGPDDPETPKSQIQKLGTDDLILILDDVSVTGQRLSWYQRNLRELKYRGRIHYLIGVSRPESDGSWDIRVRELSFRSNHPSQQHIVACVEKVILPNWEERACPWCRELSVLANLNRMNADRLGEARSLLQQRIRDLTCAPLNNGLVDNAIWHNDYSPGPQLTENSLFIEHRNATTADAIAAVAAAIQQMRVREGLPQNNTDTQKLEAEYPHVSVIDTDNYFGTTRFNDLLLRLAILRSAKRNELERWEDPKEAERRQKVREFLLQNDENGNAIRLELAVAILEGKVPRPDLSDLDWEQLEGNDGFDLLQVILNPRPAA